MSSGGSNHSQKKVTCPDHKCVCETGVFTFDCPKEMEKICSNCSVEFVEKHGDIDQKTHQCGCYLVQIVDKDLYSNYKQIRPKTRAAELSVHNLTEKAFNKLDGKKFIISAKQWKEMEKQGDYSVESVSKAKLDQTEIMSIQGLLSGKVSFFRAQIKFDHVGFAEISDEGLVLGIGFDGNSSPPPYWTFQQSTRFPDCYHIHTQGLWWTKTGPFTSDEGYEIAENVICLTRYDYNRGMFKVKMEKENHNTFYLAEVNANQEKNVSISTLPLILMAKQNHPSFIKLAGPDFEKMVKNEQRVAKFGEFQHDEGGRS